MHHNVNTFRQNYRFSYYVVCLNLRKEMKFFCIIPRECQLVVGAPCLSFDIVDDDLGGKREAYPHTCFLVSGTQAARSHTNNVIVMKMHNLNK